MGSFLLVLLNFLLLCATFNVGHGANGIPSFNLQTAASFRRKLPDSAYRINFRKGRPIKTPDFTATFADLSNFPALASSDVQYSLVQVEIKPGKPFVPHLHPRAAETIYALQGVMRNEIIFESPNPRVVKFTVKKGESTVFPQGLIHKTLCVSKTPCRFHAVLNSADPGVVFVKA